MFGILGEARQPCDSCFPSSSPVTYDKRFLASFVALFLTGSYNFFGSNEAKDKMIAALAGVLFSALISLSTAPLLFSVSVYAISRPALLFIPSTLIQP